MILFDGRRSEVCRTFPGYAEDVIVTVDSRTLAEWHLGRVTWADALHSGQLEVSGVPRFARALPTWNRLSGWAHMDDVHPMREGDSAAVNG